MLTFNSLDEMAPYFKYGAYRFTESIRLNFHLEIPCSLITVGGIEAGCGITAGEGIMAGEGIKAGWGITAGEGITALFVFSFTFSVSAKWMKTTRLPFWRGYYAEMPVATPWKVFILEESHCWNDIRNEIAPYAKEVCAWDGWHPLIRCQLEMFFGLKDKHEFEEGTHNG